MRPAKATIDLAALRHNLREARRRGAGAKVAAIVKGNAYGHGAARVLPALAEADMLGVACIEEALGLREAGAAHAILLMEGVFQAAELPVCSDAGFEIAVHEPGQLAMLEAARLARPLTVWLDVDTGMNRLGFRPPEAVAAYARLRDCPAVAEIRLMTHFSSADEPSDPATRHQIGAIRPRRKGPRARPLLLQLGRCAGLARGARRVDPARRHALRHLAFARPHRW